MLLHVPEVLNADEVAHCRRRLAEASWGGGAAEGSLQVPETCTEASDARALIDAALARSTTFFAGALPRHIFPARFNRAGAGASSGFRVDNAIRHDRRGDTDVPMRTDLSATLFLSDPGEYDGGDLIVEDTFGAHAVRLAAGDMILYPASSLYRMEPVTRGERVVASFWIQSLVRDEAHRRLLLELDVSIQSLGRANAPQEDVLRLTGIYHNLLRAWSAT